MESGDKLKEGLPNKAIGDIAKLAGKSRTVVSRVVNGKVLFSRKDGRVVRICSEEEELRIRKIAKRYAKQYGKMVESLLPLGVNQ